MHTFPSRNIAARQASGFTLVELLVVIGIIAILAGVALGPITNGIKKAQESGAMQTSRTIALAEFQYANDNSGSYPDSATTVDLICKELMNGNYVSDPNLFYISADKDTGSAKPTTASAFTAVNCSFDFMGTGGTGVGSTAPDTLPMVWTAGCAATHAAPTALMEIVPAGVFGADGMAICYHSNNAFFKTPNATGTTAPDGTTNGHITFVSSAYANGGITYTPVPGT
jgi:prepilin-type N-terminal cleavage/methylation domain-containing protein